MGTMSEPFWKKGSDTSKNFYNLVRRIQYGAGRRV